MSPTLSADQPKLPESALWQQFTLEQESGAFYGVWLNLLSLQLNRAVRAVLVLGEPDTNAYRPVAYWPEGQGGSAALSNLAERALVAKQGMAGGIDESGRRFGVAYPLLIDQHLYGVVAVEVAGACSSEQLDQSLKQLRWACGWLEARLRRDQSAQNEQLHARLVTAFELVVSALELESYDASLMAVVTELAQKLHCSRVSLGFRQGENIRVDAISHSVELEKRMNMVRAIGQAMDEAFDQRQSISYPITDASELYVTCQHEALAQQYGSGTLLTIPLYVFSDVVGALTFERPEKEPFNSSDMQLCRSVATLIAPILHEKQKNSRGFLRTILDAARDGLTTLFGKEHYLKKGLTTLATLLVISAFVINGAYRVTADTVLEGKVQRSMVAPFDSFIVEAHARAGDEIKQGQLLANLEDKDLQLERLKWLSQRSQMSKQYDEAMALRDRAKVNIITAQIAQVDAQLNLVNEQIIRTEVVAPFDGLVISGDLSQSLGGSVAQGDPLFVIAPLNDYRLILKVNERHIQQIAAEQQGVLILSSLPDERLNFSIERITPISVAEEGENYFRVEAVLTQPMDQLRPGMEGVAKVDIGERKLAWIWSHEIINWLKLWLWRWLP